MSAVEPFFPDSFLITLPTDDPVTAGHMLCQRFGQHQGVAKGSRQFYDEYVHAAEFFAQFCKEHNLCQIEVNWPDLTARYDIGHNINLVVQLFTDAGRILSGRYDALVIQRQTLRAKEAARNRYAELTGRIVVYKFSDDDFARIQRHVNELRDLLEKSEIIDKNHRFRLLKKLEGFQQELHKEVSDLSRFYGTILEFSIVLGNAGNNAQPFIKLLRDILAILYAAQAVAQGLPPGSLPPFLLSTGEEDGRC